MKKRALSLALALLMVLSLAVPAFAAGDGWQELTLTDIEGYLTITLSTAKVQEKTIHFRGMNFGYETVYDDTAKVFTLKVGSTISIVVNENVLDNTDDWHLSERMAVSGVSTAQELIGKETWAYGHYFSEVSEDTYDPADHAYFYKFNGGTIDEDWNLDMEYIPAVYDSNRVHCIFIADRGAEGTDGSFTDLPTTSPYYDAVMWATENKFAEAKSATQFGTVDPCPRGEVVEILWKALGSPEPMTTVNPFVDVKETDSFYKAVLWASEKGITAGTDGTHFSPANTVERGQAMTFIWRAANIPASSGTNPFADVPAGQYYTDAVLWAVEKGITVGTDATHFSPYNLVERGQMITFLYRQLGQ